MSAWWFAFDPDDDGFSYSNFKARWNLSLSLSNEYHHPNHKWERWNQTTLLREYRGGLLPCRSNVVFVRLSPVVVLRPHLWREITTDPLAMWWVWLETSTPLLSNCVICRGSLGVGELSFHRFFTNKGFTPRPRGEVCEALFSSVYLSSCRSVPFCHLTHTTKTCLPRVSSVK
jgi:hypothetical protein